MIRAIFWKEWREHHWKYLAYWLVLNLPMILVTLALALSKGARAPFADLSNATALKYLAVSLFGESWIVPTVFLLVTGYLAVATFSLEVEDGSLFFIYEQPLSRRRYFVIKLGIGVVHTVMAVSCAVLLAAAIPYTLMLISGKVTLAGSLGTFGAVMAGAARAAVWCSLISLVVFAGSALISALVPRWWLATAASVVFVVLFGIAAGDFFGFIDPGLPSPGTIGLGVGSPQWLTITGDIEIHAFAPWRALPLLTALVATLALSAATGLLYARKELK